MSERDGADEVLTAMSWLVVVAEVGTGSGGGEGVLEDSAKGAWSSLALIVEVAGEEWLGIYDAGSYMLVHAKQANPWRNHVVKAKCVQLRQQCNRTREP